ncbi:MAG: MBL fold metallo-hydrolase [Candidatus Puniceispirillaceae bacterium]
MTQSSWYKINNLDDGVSRILEAHVAADWRCNIWHVRGRDRDLIIDTGLGLRPIAKDIAMLAERPVIALCTHSHHDHAGGLCQFETRLGHVAEADIFANPTREATVANLLEPQSIRQLPYEGFDVADWCYRAAPLTGTVDDGDVIDLGDRVFQVLHFPGHSPGSIALWEAASGIIFTGDTLYDGTLYDHLYHSVPDQLCESLRRLRQMPVSRVHAGHFTSFGRQRMQTVIDEYLAGQRSMLCPGQTGGD